MLGSNRLASCVYYSTEHLTNISLYSDQHLTEDSGSVEHLTADSQLFLNSDNEVTERSPTANNEPSNDQVTTGSASFNYTAVMSYDLVLYLQCPCGGNTHTYECNLQSKFRINADTPPGFWCVRLGSFAIRDLDEVRDKAINEWRLYEFDVNLEPPLKKFERNGRKTYVALVSMEQEFMVCIDKLITEMELWFGPIRDYQPYFVEVAQRDPDKPKKHHELLMFEEFSALVTEIRLIEHSSGPTDVSADQFYINGQQTFKTVWRLKLLNQQTDPLILAENHRQRAKKRKKKQTMVMMILALVTTLLGLAGIGAFLLWYNRDTIF